MQNKISVNLHHPLKQKNFTYIYTSKIISANSKMQRRSALKETVTFFKQFKIKIFTIPVTW